MAVKYLNEIPLEQGYSTSSHNLISDFFVPCLDAATHYDRAVGYFRSSLFVVVGIAMSDFALRSGRFRLVCSPQLNGDDIEAIERGLREREAIANGLNRELDRILSNPENQPVVVLLSTLLACGAMDIKLACRPKHQGIFHAKLGVFHDGTHSISFVGSSNETFSAWDREGNHEAFEVFKSWTEDCDRVHRHIQSFERLWQNREKDVRTYDFPEYPKSRLIAMADSKGVRQSIDAVRRQNQRTSQTRVSPVTIPRASRRTLYPHQSAALENWIASRHRGIIQHATGSGKTVTALNAIRRWIKPGYSALVVVPSQILAEQWRDEANIELDPEIALLDAGAGFGRDRWEDALADHTRNLTELGPRVVIATMQTASTGAFLRKVQSGPHLLLVADEVHRIGSPQHRRILGIDAGGRLGLSATPERYGDPEGTAAIFAYFGKAVEPHFGLGDAIEAGRLVPYEYYIHQVSLTAYEQDAWDELTERIRAAYARLPEEPDGGKVHTDAFRLLLIRRARIIKQARAKVECARRVVASEYLEGDRWLVYCDDQTQLQATVAALQETGLSCAEYHSNMLGSRLDTLQYFHDHEGILVAIKCLDEGVDIPRVNRALVLASSANPREFVQRRGRVLRVAPGKFSATVHDVMVVPFGEFDADDPHSTIVRTEIRRARLFAHHARNHAAKHQIEILARRLGVVPRLDMGTDFEDIEEEADNGRV